MSGPLFLESTRFGGLTTDADSLDSTVNRFEAAGRNRRQATRRLVCREKPGKAPVQKPDRQRA